jgi:hypothetical protein
MMKEIETMISSRDSKMGGVTGNWKGARENFLGRWKIQIDTYIYIFLNFFAVQGLELKAYTLSHSTSFVFQDRVLHTICPGWLQTSILLISVS